MAHTPDQSNPLTGPFWRAAQNEKLMLPRCLPCEKVVWYPESQCPNCGGTLKWQEVSGRGTVAAFSIVHRPLFQNAKKWAPYMPALVSIDEDTEVRLVTQIIDCEPENVACDTTVEVVFRELKLPDGETYKAPMFRPR